MRTSTGTFDTANALLVKFPVILADFNGIVRRYCSQTFGDISANEKKYLLSLTANLGNIEPLTYTTEIEETEVEIQDKDLDVSDKLKDNDFEGRDLTIKAGFQALDETDFVSFPSVKVRHIQQGGNLLSWIFTARDPKIALKDNVFRSMPVSTLSADLAAAGANFTVGDSDAFIDPDELPDAIRAGVVIDNEVIRYTTINFGTETFSNLTKGNQGTGDSDHFEGAEVTQCLIFSNCNMYTALLFILMTTDDGSGHAYYDLNQHLTTPQVSGIGLGLSASDVDFEQIERLGWKYFERGTEYGFRAIGYKSEKGVDWIKREVLEPCASILYTLGGKLTTWIFDFLEIIENYSPVDTLNDTDDIVGFEPPEIDLDNLINVIELHYSIHPITKQPEKIDKWKLTESVTDYGQNQFPFIVRHTNLPGATNTNFVADAILRRWFYLWGNQTGIWDITTHFKNFLVEPGDDLSITHSKFVDLTDASRGWSAKKSKVLSQELVLGIDEDPVFRLTGFTWEMFTRVSSFFTIDKILEADFITGEGIGTAKRALTFSANNTAAKEAEDAFYDDTSSLYQGFIFWIELTPPGAGSGFHTIDLGFHVQDIAGPADFIADSRLNIRYDPSESTPYNLAFMLWANSPIANADRYKVDFFDATATAPSGERPALKFFELWRITLDQEITTL